MGRHATHFPTRFWSNVKRGKRDECWEWQGSRCGAKCEYGSTYYNGRNMVAHRAAWLLTYGMLPLPGLEICHKCDNGLCCNPRHLWIGTHKQNMEDRDQKGRHHTPKGSETTQAKLTEDKVIEIRSLLDRGLSQRTIAKQFGVSQPTICYINKSHAWVHCTTEAVA